MRHQPQIGPSAAQYPPDEARQLAGYRLPHDFSFRGQVVVGEDVASPADRRPGNVRQCLPDDRRQSVRGEIVEVYDELGRSKIVRLILIEECVPTARDDARNIGLEPQEFFPRGRVTVDAIPTRRIDIRGATWRGGEPLPLPHRPLAHRPLAHWPLALWPIAHNGTA